MFSRRGKEIRAIRRDQEAEGLSVKPLGRGGGKEYKSHHLWQKGMPWRKGTWSSKIWKILDQNRQGWVRIV